MKSFSNIMHNFADNLHLLVDSIHTKFSTFLYKAVAMRRFLTTFATAFCKECKDILLNRLLITT